MIDLYDLATEAKSQDDRHWVYRYLCLLRSGVCGLDNY